MKTADLEIGNDGDEVLWEVVSNHAVAPHLLTVGETPPGFRQVVAWRGLREATGQLGIALETSSVESGVLFSLRDLRRDRVFSQAGSLDADEFRKQAAEACA